MSAEIETTAPLKETILSLDPGLNFTGISISDVNNGFKVIESVLVKNARAFTESEKVVEAAFGPRAVKVAAILAKTEELIEKYKPSILVIEAPFYNSLTPAAYGSLLEVIFAIKYTIIIKQNLKFVLMEPTLVKKMFTSKGNAGKDIMRQFLTVKKEAGEIVLPVEVDTLSEHEVDAVAIGFVYYLTTLTEKV